MVARDHDYQNVVVTVRESHKTEYVVAIADSDCRFRLQIPIADSDGEFVVSEPVYHDTCRVHFVEEAQSAAELRATRRLGQWGLLKIDHRSRVWTNEIARFQITRI